MFFTAFPLFMPKSELLLSLFASSLFFKGGQEQFALVAPYKRWQWANFSKRATVIVSLLSFITKERLFKSESLFPSQKTKDLLEKNKEPIPNPVLSPRTDMWGAVTNTGYNGMPTSLGRVQTLIHCSDEDLVQTSHVHSYSTSWCPSVSVDAPFPFPLDCGLRHPAIPRYLTYATKNVYRLRFV